ncbi:hypothetical protein BKA18_003092 [Streptomyces auratus]
MRIVTHKEAFGRYGPDEHHPATLTDRPTLPGESA